MSEYDDAIRAITSGVLVRLIGDRGTRLDEAWGALPDAKRMERIEDCEEFVSEAIGCKRALWLGSTGGQA